MAFPGYIDFDSALTFMNHGNIEMEGLADSSASFYTYRCKEVMGKNEVAGSTDREKS
ncbi:hypothetical protein [Endozoicomonas atrinae]|uniref:hypothetical protein n=1 Tax=Endozoicomonas atrinae TaxID=1333660 RepID=UPI003B005CC3